MREIKFRGKRVDNGQWVEGSLIQSDDGMYIFDRKEEYSPIMEIPEYHAQGMGCGLEDRCIHDRYDAMAHGWNEAIDYVVENMPNFHEVLPETVGQYIGVEDVSGREIFEGNICLREDGQKCIIKFYANSWCMDMSDFYPMCKEGWCENMLGTPRLEIIGDIHDREGKG